MIFTEYLRFLLRRGYLQTLWLCIDHDGWPAASAQLEDYESFLRRYVDCAQLTVIPELRRRWREWFVDASLNGRLNLALAAWRDYALHLRDCDWEPAGTCPRAGVLLARAVAESRFRDFPINEPDPISRDEADLEALLARIDRLFDQVSARMGVRADSRSVLPLRREP